MQEKQNHELSHIGNIIHAYRTSKNITRQELADLCGISLTTLNRIKSGETSINLDTAIRIASVLQVSLDELVGLPTTPAIPPTITAQLSSLEALAAEQAATISAQQSTINALTADIQAKDTQLALYADAIGYHKDISRRNDLFCKILLALVLLVTLVFVFVGL